jgi:RimJ/RimL family protein N-acetyltransferase
VSAGADGTVRGWELDSWRETVRWTGRVSQFARSPTAAGAPLLLKPLAVVDALSGERLGTSGLVVIDWDRRAADVGYWVAAGARGRGVASRALVLLTRWAFDVLSLERLEQRPRPQNVASRAVARRAGFKPNARPVISRPECDTLPDTLF